MFSILVQNLSFIVLCQLDQAVGVKIWMIAVLFGILTKIKKNYLKSYLHYVPRSN